MVALRNSMINHNWIEDELLVIEAKYPRAVLLEGRSLNEELLREGVSTETVRSVVQYIVGAAAEYGVGGVTVPAAGAGVAVGPATETVVDALFGAERVAQTVLAVKNIGDSLGEFSDLFQDGYQAYKSMRSDLKSFYKKLRMIIQKALKTIGKSVAGKVDGLAKKLKGIVENLVNQIVGALKAGIKLVVPEATVGTAIAEGLAAILTALAERPFTLAQRAIDSVETLKSWVADPSKASEFFGSIFKQLLELLELAGKKAKKMGWVKALLSMGPAMGTLMKTHGEAIFAKIGSLFEKYWPTVKKVIDQVLNVVVPVFFTLLGVWQILMTGEYKEKSTDKATDKATAGAAEKLAAGKIVIASEKDIRKIIRESMLKNSYN